MDKNEVDQILSELIENSRFSEISDEQKEILKYKLLQKFISTIYKSAYDLLDDSKKEEYSKILATKNSQDILNFIDKNIPNFSELIDTAISKFTTEVEDYF
jgi:hypothetical protein